MLGAVVTVRRDFGVGVISATVVALGVSVIWAASIAIGNGLSLRTRSRPVFLTAPDIITRASWVASITIAGTPPLIFTRRTVPGPHRCRRMVTRLAASACMTVVRSVYVTAVASITAGRGASPPASALNSIFRISKRAAATWGGPLSK